MIKYLSSYGFRIVVVTDTALREALKAHEDWMNSIERQQMLAREAQ